MQRKRRKKTTPPLTDWAGTRPSARANGDEQVITQLKEQQAAEALVAPNRENTMQSYYPVDAPERAYRAALLGLTNAELGVVFGVAESTIVDWMGLYEAFRAAVYAGREAADGEVVRALYKKAVGYEHEEMYVTTYQGQVIEHPVTRKYAPDTAACIYWLNNRTRHNRKPWTNSQKMELMGAGGGPILLAPAEAEAVSQLTEEELKLITSSGIKLQSVDPKLLEE